MEVSRKRMAALLDKCKEYKTDFETEKKAKNDAYYFIISNGLLDLFTTFCKEYKGNSLKDIRENLELRIKYS